MPKPKTDILDSFKYQKQADDLAILSRHLTKAEGDNGKKKATKSKLKQKDKLTCYEPDLNNSFNWMTIIKGQGMDLSNG